MATRENRTIASLKARVEALGYVLLRDDETEEGSTGYALLNPATGRVVAES